MSQIPPPPRSYLHGRIRSFGYAFRGIVLLVRTQPNAQIHLLATLGVIALAAGLGVTAGEWCLLLLAMGLVWVTEALNTGLEKLTDKVSPEYHPLAGQAKDVAAGAVLLAALTAAAVGCILLGPRLFTLLFPG